MIQFHLFIIRSGWKHQLVIPFFAVPGWFRNSCGAAESEISHLAVQTVLNSNPIWNHYSPQQQQLQQQQLQQQQRQQQQQQQQQQ